MNKRRDILKANDAKKVYNPAGDSFKEIQEMNRLGGNDSIETRGTTTYPCASWYTVICC